MIPMDWFFGGKGDGRRFHANLWTRVFKYDFFIVDLKPNPTGSPTTTTPSASVDPFKTTGTTGTHSTIAIFYMCFISRQVAPCPLLNKTSYSMMGSAHAM